MKIYLAGPCDTANRTMMVNIAKDMRNFMLNLNLYCPFELKIDNAWDYSQEEWSQKVFNTDVAAIDACDAMIMISLGRISSAGTNWEQGYAFAKGKQIFVLQITEEPTSLMTYCGCYYFMNVTKDTLIQEIHNILVHLIYKKDEYYKAECKTILT